MRPAAPARLSWSKLLCTDQEPPVTMTPHFGSVSTCTTSTWSQLASSSSATTRASAVPMCWPISALVTWTRMRPSPPISYQSVGL
jgi:hypothetical protein